MRHLIMVFSALVMGVLCFANAAYAAQVQIYDRATGQQLSTYSHHGRTYVIGEPGHEYEIRVHSSAAQRSLAVATVDGVNVITGETGATNQSGYVLDPYGYVGIEGWRKSMSRTAAFYFTKLPDSYAARTGRPNNVGVIGVAMFRERMPCCMLERETSRNKKDEVTPSPSSESARGMASRDARDKSAAAPQQESKLGTGHGRSEYSAAQYSEFERASNAPDETIAIYYDSRRNLIAQGIIPALTRYANQNPQPFPGSFVPDP